MITPEFLTVAYGLGTAFTFGAGDFSGGFATRRGSVLAVTFFSHIAGALLLTVMALMFQERVPGAQSLMIGGLAGVFGVFGLLSLYRGLAMGRMGVVAPISAVVSAILPIMFAFFNEGLPEYTRIAGFAAAILAVWFLTFTDGALRIGLNEVILALTAGVGFGFFFITISKTGSESVFWPLVAAKVSAVGVISILFIIKGGFERLAGAQIIPSTLAGICDASGNAFFILAITAGRLDIAAALSSLYPATTVLLAWRFQDEKLEGRQWFGVFAALVALVLMSA